MRYSTFFLDFYGTLAHGEPSYVDLVQEACIQNGKPAPQPQALEGIADWYRMCDDACEASFRTEWELLLEYLSRVWKHFELTSDIETVARRLFQAESDAIPYPETHTFLEALKQHDVKVGIVSNADNCFVYHAIAKLNFDFDFIITSENSRAYKPHTLIFEHALEAAQCKPDQVIHVGDSWHCDIQGAARLGISSIWINRKNTLMPEGHKPLLTVDRLDAMLPLL